MQLVRFFFFEWPCIIDLSHMHCTTICYFVCLDVLTSGAWGLSYVPLHTPVTVIDTHIALCPVK